MAGFFHGWYKGKYPLLPWMNQGFWVYWGRKGKGPVFLGETGIFLKGWSDADALC